MANPEKDDQRESLLLSPSDNGRPENDLPSLPNLKSASQSRLYTAPEESESVQNAAREDLARNLAPLINDDDEDDNALMDPNHPLMKTVQDALKKQLLDHHKKLDLELRDKEDSIKKSVKKREQIGVELYAVQEQLARVQAMTESAEDNFGVIRNLREEAERAQKQYAEQYNLKQEKWRHQNKKLDQHKQELEKISRSIKQVDVYSDELRSKILVAKRTTLKAEEDLTNQENEKKRQDYFIDDLTEQLRKLQERRALYETQLLAQQKETKAAQETLHDASTEMEAIQFEKRQLIQQWKSSVIGIQKREDVLRQIEVGIATNEETISSMDCELSGFRRSLRNAQEESETLMGLFNKIENEIEYVKKQTMIINDQKDKLRESYQMYTKILEQTEEELKKINEERQAIQNELSAVHNLSQKVIQGNQKLEQDITESLQAQLATQNGIAGWKRDGARLRALISEKEGLIALTQNDLSVTRLETLDTSARLQSLLEQTKRLDEECILKSQLMEKYEQEMKRRGDELGKKSSEMGLLNRKLEQLTGGDKDMSNIGPLEATVRNLTNSIKAKEKECTQVSQYWLRAQNELVALTKNISDIVDESQDLKMKLAVLTRKKMVVNNAFESEEKQIKGHQANIRKLQNEMVKINLLLSQQSNFQSQLEENNLELEQEFRAKLKSAELESVRLEQKIEDINHERERALMGLLESERQIMLWEKKIQIAKETQAALDPNIGATEIKEMTLEIHRMKLRLASMQKLQEKMIAEMEKAVYRRESISSKSKLRGKHVGPGSLQKAIADLTKKIKTTINDIQECDNDLNSLETSKVTIEMQIQEAQDSNAKLEQQERDLAESIELRVFERQLNMDATLLHQKHQKRFRDLEQGKYTPLAQDAEERLREFAKTEERIEKIENIIQSLQMEGDGVLKKPLDLIQTFIQGSMKEIKAIVFQE